MKPDKPGEWHSRDGRKIVVWDYSGMRWWRDLSETRQLSHNMYDVPGDDWLPAVAPTFPELLPKPLAVFAKTKNRLYPARWFAQGVDGYFLSPCGYRYTADRLCVVPHPDNDPEAVRMIQEAKA